MGAQGGWIGMEEVAPRPVDGRVDSMGGPHTRPTPLLQLVHVILSFKKDHLT